MSKSGDEVHVVALPWSAFGHLIPFFDLSIALARSGIHVSYISTPRNILRLPRVPPNLSSLIHFISLPLPGLTTNPLPENTEATVDIQPDQMECLKLACDLLQEPIRDFIAEKRPDWIMTDFFPHWAVDIGREFNIPLVNMFIMSSASSAVFFGAPQYLLGGTRTPQDLTVTPDWVDFPSQVACRSHEAIDLHNVLHARDATGLSGGERLGKLIQASRTVAVRSSMELEGEYIKLYSKEIQKPVFPLGYFPPEKLEAGRGTISQEPWRETFDWLDKQELKSVVFVGFGSEAKLKKEQIYEIAYGLELSGLPFLWALRKPDWTNDDSVNTTLLPPGFSSRTMRKGVVQIGWAPQREILAHPSVGGSLFHAGWASTVETISYGHCLVLLPLVISQPLDSRLLVEKGLAVEVKTGDNGSFTGNDIAEALRKAMDSDQGKALRGRTEEAAESTFGNQRLNDDYINNFAQYLKTARVTF